MIKKLIFLGAPGVGKGTLAAEIAKGYGLKHISTGEIFRAEIAAKTKLGLQVQEILNAGIYVSDDITNAIVKGVLERKEIQESGFILDGYPRTTNQADFLRDNGFDIDAVVLLVAPDELVIKRLLGRGRPDDTAETIKKRIEIYNDQTKPLIKYYEELELVKTVDAAGDITENLIALEGSLF